MATLSPYGGPQQFEFEEEQPLVPQVSQEEPSSPDSASQVGQFAKGLGVRAIQAPFRLLGDLPIAGIEYAAQKLDLPIERRFEKNPSEYVEEFLGAGDIEPENMFSRALQYTAGNWPLLFVGGAPTLAKLGADVAGSLGIAGAQSLGLGTIGQIGASILGAKGFDSLSKFMKSAFKTAPKNIGKIGVFKSGLYNTEKELGSKIPVNTSSLNRRVSDLKQKVEGQFVGNKFRSADKNALLNNIEIVEKSLEAPTKTASELFDLKKGLNTIYTDKNTILGRYTRDLRNIVKDSLDEVAKDHKPWGTVSKTADQLHAIENWQSGLGRFIDSISGTNKFSKIASSPLTQGALSLLSGGLGYGKAALASFAPLGIRGAVRGTEYMGRALQFLNELSKTKSGQQLLWEIVVDSAKDSTASLTSSINKVNRRALSFDKKNKRTSHLIPTVESSEEWEFDD